MSAVPSGIILIPRSGASVTKCMLPYNSLLFMSRTKPLLSPHCFSALADFERRHLEVNAFFGREKAQTGGFRGLVASTIHLW
jgi:hypothetical protein